MHEWAHQKTDIRVIVYTKDIIKNDTIILVLPLTFNSSSYFPHLASSLKFADVFFLVDSTASRPEFQQIRNFLIRLVNQLGVNKDGNHVGLAQFSDNVEEEFLFNTNKTRNEILSSIRNFRLKPKGVRQIGNAIEHARKNFFNTSTGSRVAQGFKQVLLVTSVGKSNDSVIRPSRTIKKDGIHVISVGLGKAEMDELDDISSPNQTHKMIASNISQVVQKVKPVIESQDDLNISQGVLFCCTADYKQPVAVISIILKPRCSFELVCVTKVMF